MIVSSRENFLICLDYETRAIKWILGDPTKKWYQFPSLRRFALTLAPGSLHLLGNTPSRSLLIRTSWCLITDITVFFRSHPESIRAYSSPRKYKLDLNARTATEVWNFELGQSIFVHVLCGVSMKMRRSTISLTLHLSTALQPDSFVAVDRLKRRRRNGFSLSIPQRAGCTCGL